MKKTKNKTFEKEIKDLLKRHQVVIRADRDGDIYVETARRASDIENDVSLWEFSIKEDK